MASVIFTFQFKPPCSLQGNLRESSLIKLLAVTKQLEYLQWHWDYNSKPEDQIHTPVIDLDQVYEALSYTWKTLVRVDIFEAYKPAKERSIHLPQLSTKGYLNVLIKFEKIEQFSASLCHFFWDST
jgi:hypothetical protein